MLSRNFYQKLLLLFLCGFVLLFARETAKACSCGPRPTVLDSYEQSEVVIIVRLVSVEKAQDTEGYRSVNGVRSATMVVEKVFKGKVKVRDELVFGQGGGGDCIWTFDEKWVGERFLFYTQLPKKDSSTDYPPFRESHWWYAGTCGRSNALEFATEDLLYLENISKLRGKTRISGRVGGGWRNPDLDVENKLVKIIGPTKTYKLKTDAQGVFEIYDVPAGKYLIEPEVPPGYKIDGFMLRYSPSLFRDDEGETDTKPIQVAIILEPKKHASVHIDFEIDNVVRGKVTDRTGKPMQGVSVTLLAKDEKKTVGPFDYTDEKGEFAITEVGTGEYILAVNADGKLSAHEPFKTLYYPNVADRDRAAPITLRPGAIISDIHIVVPALEEMIVIEGLLKYSDGNPVADQSVHFKAKAMEGIDGGSGAKTDADGRFSIRVLKGLKGELSAEDWVFLGEYLNCPKVDSLIKQGGKTSLTVTTNVIKIEADQDVYALELIFPFPKCEKAKH